MYPMQILGCTYTKIVCCLCGIQIYLNILYFIWQPYVAARWGGLGVAGVGGRGRWVKAGDRKTTCLSVIGSCLLPSVASDLERSRTEFVDASWGWGCLM